MGEPYTIGTFTASDGYEWRYRRYLTQGEPRAVVVCVHGIQSHGGWYGHSSSRLARAGFETFFLDRRGAGLNPKARGDTPTFRRLIHDLVEFLRWLRQATTVPVFLVGISWGGKVVSAVWRSHPWLFDGLVLVCPGFFPQFRPHPLQFFRLMTLLPVWPKRQFDIPLNDPELFTAVPRWQQFIAQDPLALRRCTARMVLESYLLDFYLRNRRQWIPVPVLLFLAGRDQIIHNEPTRRFLPQIAIGETEIIEYLDEHHTLEFGENPDRYVRDLIRWIERHLECTTACGLAGAKPQAVE